MQVRQPCHKIRISVKRLFRICSAALAAMLVFTVASVLANDDADYPDHVKDEIRAAQLEREARLIMLELELQNLRDSVLDAKIRKFENVRTLLQADQEMRVLLDQHPELYSLYQTTLGLDAGPPPAVLSPDVPDIEFCGCLHEAQVLWLGQREQTGQAVLALEDALYDVRAGGKLGGSLCTMQEADGERAILECRNPLQNVILRHSITIKRFHRTEISEPVPDIAG